MIPRQETDLRAAFSDPLEAARSLTTNSLSHQKGHKYLLPEDFYQDQGILRHTYMVSSSVIEPLVFTFPFDLKSHIPATLCRQHTHIPSPVGMNNSNLGISNWGVCFMFKLPPEIEMVLNTSPGPTPVLIGSNDFVVEVGYAHVGYVYTKSTHILIEAVHGLGFQNNTMLKLCSGIAEGINA